MGRVVAVIHRGVIDLAHESDFTLGEAMVRPATREVIGTERREVLQPRVMQVLVALAGRSGEVVTKDELVALCWGGRAIGEDAIHRCIARLRRLSDAFGGFKIETLTRVGYRLSETTVPPAARKARVNRVVVASMAAAVAVVAAIAVAVALWFSGSAHRPPAAAESPEVAVQAFKPLGGGAADAALAARISDGMLSAFEEAGVRTSAPGQATRWRIGGTAWQDGQVVRARVELTEAATRVPVWTAQFARPAGQEEALQAEVGGAASEAIYAAHEATQTPGVNLSAKAVAAFIRGYSAAADPGVTNLREPLHAFQEMVALAPDSAIGHGSLAMGYQFASVYSTSAEAASLIAAARQEAAKSISLDAAAAGPAYLALTYLDQSERPHDLLAQEDVILDGLAHAPKHPFLHAQECAFLLEVGRAEAASPQCQQASVMRPLAAPINLVYAHTMVQMGHLDWATNYLAHVSPYHPDNLHLKVQLFEIGAFLGPPAATEAMLQNPKMPNVRYWPGLRPMLLLLHARRTGSPADAEAAVAALRDAVRQGQTPRWLVMGASVLGRLDDAFAATREFPQLDSDPSYLFAPATVAMRRDPRFWEVAERNGLLRYWKVRRVWPDFCSDRTMGIDCAKAARATGAWARVAG
jgi:DNA-binding winged helix-turn-helix (wHTH) protein